MIKVSLFQQMEELPTVKVTDKYGNVLNVEVLSVEKTIHGYVVELEGLQLKRGRKAKS